MPITIDKSKCPQNHPCPAIRVCSAQALTQEGYNAPEVDKEKCIECGACSNFCPMGALQIN